MLPLLLLSTLHTSFSPRCRETSKLEWEVGIEKELGVSSSMAAATDATASPSPSPSPPPVIGKIGPYTVFLTPPPTSPIRTTAADPISETPKKVAPQQPSKLPPVRPPPAQFTKPSARHHDLGFFHNAVSRLQTAHSSLDEYVANWLGLNQSKYQWALDDYHEAKGLEKGDAKTKEMSSRSQHV